MRGIELETRHQEIFNERNKEEIYRASERLAELIKEHDYQSIVFIDASARPISTGLTAYWHKAYPDEHLPDIYFINPDGLHPMNSSPEMREFDSLLAALMGGRIHQDEGPVDQASIDRLQEVHRRLMAHKDQPTLIVDTCSHTGSTIKRLTDALQRSGFGQIETATVSPNEDEQNPPDYHLIPREADKHCYPFGPEGMIEKRGDVVSEPTSDRYARIFGARLRHEIKDIVEERFVAPPKA